MVKPREATTNNIFGWRCDGDPPSPGAVLRPSATEHTRAVGEKAKKIAGHLFRLPLAIHATSIALWTALVGLLSFAPAAKLAHNSLSALLRASLEPRTFKPLGALNWVLHAVVFAFSLEMQAAFSLLMHQSDDIHKKRAYKGFAAAYSLSYFQSIATMISHAFIGTNRSLEYIFSNWFTALLRTLIFGTGLSVSLGSWTLIPVFAGVNLGVVGYDNWVGRGLATYTLYKHLASEELPSLFKSWYVCLNVLPFLSSIILGLKEGVVYTDANHTLVTAALAIISGGMVSSLNQRVNVGESIIAAFENDANGISFGQNSKVMYDNIIDGVPRVFRSKTKAKFDRAIIEVCRGGLVTEQDMHEVARSTTPKMFLQRSFDIIDEHKTTT